MFCVIGILLQVLCPCTRLGGGQDKCFLSIRLFDNVGYTCQFQAKFPLTIYESFTFIKDFEDVDDRIELTETLTHEPVIITLYQSTMPEGNEVKFIEPDPPFDQVLYMERKPAGKTLAQFSGNAMDFLFPKPTLKPPKTGLKDFFVRPVRLSSQQFTQVFSVEPEMLFCTHCVVRESCDADIEHNLRPSKEQLISRLVMAQIEQRSAAANGLNGLPLDLLQSSSTSIRNTEMDLSIVDLRSEGIKKRLAKRIQTVKKKCYMCELRKCFLDDMDEVFKGEDVLPPPPGHEIQPDYNNNVLLDDCDPDMDFEIHDEHVEKA